MSATCLGDSPLQILLDVVITVKLGQVNEDPRGTAAVALPAVAAVADAPAGRAHPALGGDDGRRLSPWCQASPPGFGHLLPFHLCHWGGDDLACLLPLK